MPTYVLNLPDYKVVRVEETDHDYHITAEISNTPTVCLACSSERLIGHGRNQQVIRDIPTHGKRVAIYVNTRRWRCQSCGKTFMEAVPAVNAKREMTDRLVRWIGPQSVKRTFASIADDTGLDEKTIRNIFRDYVIELEALVHFETPQWMGIDDIFLIKQRCVISNIQSNTVVEVLANREEGTLAKYLSQLTHRDKVHVVSIGMWAPYRDAVTAVIPQAKIVIDKFHVIKLANDAMEKARQGIRVDLDLKRRRSLLHDRFVTSKRERDLSEMERLNLVGWTKNYPALGEAYRLKEDFCGIYEGATSRSEALGRYEAWYRSVAPEMVVHFSDLIRAFDNWQPWILNYFDHKMADTGLGELNRLNRVMDRMGRGYSFDAQRAKILFTEGSHKKENRRPKFQRMRDTSMDIRFSYASSESLLKVESMGRMHIQQDPQNVKSETVNYGADIITLIRLLEQGKL